jgi:hypothetical protein
MMPIDPTNESIDKHRLEIRRDEYDAAAKIVGIMQPLSCASRKEVRRLLSGVFPEKQDAPEAVTIERHEE